MGNSQSELRKYNTVLHDIQKQKINMDENVTKRNNAILHHIRETLFEELEKDDFFRSLWKNDFHYTGSFYESLRISAATEFDINLILMLPFNYNNDLNLVHLTKSYGALLNELDLDRCCS